MPWPHLIPSIYFVAQRFYPFESAKTLRNEDNRWNIFSHALVFSMLHRNLMASFIWKEELIDGIKFLIHEILFKVTFFM